MGRERNIKKRYFLFVIDLNRKKTKIGISEMINPLEDRLYLVQYIMPMWVLKNIIINNFNSFLSVICDANSKMPKNPIMPIIIGNKMANCEVFKLVILTNIDNVIGKPSGYE